MPEEFEYVEDLEREANIFLKKEGSNLFFLNSKGEWRLFTAKTRIYYGHRHMKVIEILEARDLMFHVCRKSLSKTLNLKDFVVYSTVLMQDGIYKFGYTASAMQDKYAPLR